MSTIGTCVPHHTRIVVKQNIEIYFQFKLRNFQLVAAFTMPFFVFAFCAQKSMTAYAESARTKTVQLPRTEMIQQVTSTVICLRACVYGSETVKVPEIHNRQQTAD